MQFQHHIGLFKGYLNIIGVIPNNLLVAEGGTAKFNITASSIGRLSYQWKKRGDDQLPSKVLGNDTSILRIPNLDKSDEGQYYCIVTTLWNASSQSDFVNLTVQGKFISVISLIDVMLTL